MNHIARCDAAFCLLAKQASAPRVVRALQQLPRETLTKAYPEIAAALQHSRAPMYAPVEEGSKLFGMHVPAAAKKNIEDVGFAIRGRDGGKYISREVDSHLRPTMAGSNLSPFHGQHKGLTPEHDSIFWGSGYAEKARDSMYSKVKGVRPTLDQHILRLFRAANKRGPADPLAGNSGRILQLAAANKAPYW